MKNIHEIFSQVLRERNNRNSITPVEKTEYVVTRENSTHHMKKKKKKKKKSKKKSKSY